MDFWKILIYTGFLLVLIGFIVMVLSKFTSIGKLPGDMYFKKGNFSFYFPIITCLLLSLILSIIFNLFGSGK